MEALAAITDYHWTGHAGLAPPMPELTAPVPYFGGKRRVAAEVWHRLGPVDTYIEPFMGSLAVFLACPYGPRPREIVNDLDGLVCNFWRAVRSDPGSVAYWADWPTSHIDLTARITYVRQQNAGLRERLVTDVHYYDAKTAGYWAYCVSNSIAMTAAFNGVGEGDGDDGPAAPDNRRPHVTGISSQGVRRGIGKDNAQPFLHPSDGGKGVTAQRHSLPDGLPPDNRRPYVRDLPHGRGVSVQRKDLPPSNARPLMNHDEGGIGLQPQRKSLPFSDSIPLVRPGGARGVSNGGAPANSIPHMTHNQGVAQGLHRPNDNAIPWMGVHGLTAQRVDGMPVGATPMTGERLRPWLYALSHRLANCYVLSRPWDTPLSRSVLGTLEPSKVCGVFLDPPYATASRARVYKEDSLSVAAEVQKWAIAHAGDRVRVCVAGYVGDYDEWPDGWTLVKWGQDGVRMGGQLAEYDRTEGLWFSPGCLDPADGPAVAQLGLWSDGNG